MNSSSLTKLSLHKLQKEVDTLKEPVAKPKLIKATRAQKTLLMYQLGMLDAVLKIDISISKKSKLLSIIINEDSDNIRKDLSKIRLPKSDLINEANYEFLKKAFLEAGMDEQAAQIEQTLSEIKQQKNK